MKKGLKNIIVVLTLCFAIKACNPNTAPTTRPQGQKNANQKPSCNDQGNNENQDEKNKNCSPEDKSNIYDTSSQTFGAPKFQQADGNINKQKITQTPQKPEEDKGKKFLVQRVNKFRPVWLNLSKQVKGEKFASVSFDGEIKDPPTISAFLPMPRSADAGYSRTTDQFRIISHLVYDKTELTTDKEKIAVVSLYPDTPEDMSAMMPVANWKMIYSELATADIAKVCKKIQEQGMKGDNINVVDEKKCDMIQNGMNSINDFYTAKNSQYGVQGLKFQNYFTWQNVSVWVPAPPDESYGCLGVIFTNTEDQPLTSLDGAGRFGRDIMYDVGAVERSGTDAQYCIKREYLTKAKLAPFKERKYGGKTVSFYKVVPDDKADTKDEDKGVDLGTFWAISDEASRLEKKDKVKVYTIKKKFVKLLKDK